MTNRILLAVMASLIGSLTMVAQNWIIQPRSGLGFNYPFADGLAIIQDEVSGLYGVIDTTGREVMSCQFINRPDFTLGQAVIMRYIEGLDQTDSYLLESSGRITKFSVAVDFSLGHNYFAKIIEPAFDADIESITRYAIYKIANPNILLTGGALRDIQLVPAFGDQLFDSVSPFAQDLMLIHLQPAYFIEPSGKVAFELPNTEWCEGFNEYGYAQYMDADSAHLINTQNKKCFSYPRDADRMQQYYYQCFDKQHVLLTSSLIEDWEGFLITLGSTNNIQYVGKQCSIFPLDKAGRYWDLTVPKSESETYVATLKSVDGQIIKTYTGYQIESIHGSYAALSKENELLITDFDGIETLRLKCEYSWYAGNGYLWITQENKTGLIKIKP